MKLKLENCPDILEDEMILRYIRMDKRIQALTDYVRQYLFHLVLRKEDKEYRISLDKIFYLDSADGKTFVYTENEVYECRETLISMESKLKGTPFARISRNCIINTEWMQCVRPIGNHRLEAIMKNQERLIVSRNYILVLKEKLIKGGVI